MNNDSTEQSAPGEEPHPEENPASAPAPETDPAAELEKFRDLALRARADLDNYRKRVIREKEESLRYANMTLLEKLLPILDNFDLGVDSARSAGGGDTVVAGFEMVRRQLEDFLRDHNVEPIVTEGSAFDPNLHDAMGSEPSDIVPEGHVIRQLRKGYKLRDRLLRPASVFVSTGSAK